MKRRATPTRPLCPTCGGPAERANFASRWWLCKNAWCSQPTWSTSPPTPTNVRVLEPEQVEK